TRRRGPRAGAGGSAARFGARPLSLPAAGEGATRVRSLGLSAGLAGGGAEAKGQAQARGRRRSPELFVASVRVTMGRGARIHYIWSMKGEEVIARLRQQEADLKRLGVEHLYLFGSIARGEATEDSDIDLFFDYKKGKLGFFELMDVKTFTASILGHTTDIMTRDSLHKTLRRTIEATALRVF